MSFATFNLYVLGIFLGAVALQLVFLRMGGWFRSAERKAGTYRAGGGQGKSSKLPMTGGPAMIVAALAGGILIARIFSTWPGAWPVAVAVAGFGAVGLLDDFGKYRGRGLPQSLKTVGCLVVAAVVAWALLSAGGASFSLGVLIRWAVTTAFLFCFAVAADFSDGIDGLAGGLGLIASFAMLLAAVVAHRAGASLWAVAFVVVLAFYLFNLPSAWTSRGAVPRRARVYVGDSGALAMGGGMAATALWMHLGWVFVLAAAVWVIAGFSSAWQAEFLVKRVYRRRGRVERYGSARAPHTEFPLPLLAAPIHHHFEVAGWGRLEIVRLLYGVGLVAGMAAVVAAVGGGWLAAGYVLAGATLAALWSLAGLYRTFYLAVGPAGWLALNSGVPFHLGQTRYHKTVLVTDLSAADLGSEERLWLYRPMPRPDAMEVLVRLLLAHGQAEEAAKVADGLPAALRAMRLGDALPEPEDA
jgi:phospho-N-acetylmuramoyl-pentapeptide-transferase